MLDLPMVNSCVILVEGAEGDDKFLVSYVVPEGQTTKREIREALKKRLPFYMIPSYFIFLTRSLSPTLQYPLESALSAVSILIVLM